MKPKVAAATMKPKVAAATMFGENLETFRATTIGGRGGELPKITGTGSEDPSVDPYKLKQNGRHTSSGAGYSGDSIVSTPGSQVLSPVI